MSAEISKLETRLKELAEERDAEFISGLQEKLMESFSSFAVLFLIREFNLRHPDADKHLVVDCWLESGFSELDALTVEDAAMTKGQMRVVAEQLKKIIDA